ncbi:sensor histidine kinase [Hydrogenophaga palleronii]|uniref:sensor histidine kinase n=1 Tax=Hydrogenophaga palleronii TaxID=65655 RepID=UPI000826B04F|nr:sensor histidine kinase [Hydrogenophaga palleronii]
MAARQRSFLAWLPPWRRGSGSLHRQLLIWLLLPQLVVWVGGGLAAYKLAERYTNGAVDGSLSQASRALARQIKTVDNGLPTGLPNAARAEIEADPNEALQYMVSSPPGSVLFGNRTLPLPAADALRQATIGEPYFYNANLPDPAAGGGAEQRLRVAAIVLRHGANASDTLLVQVARNRASRAALARGILIDILLPLAGLLVLMTVAVWAGIRAGLAPLARLRHEVEGRAPTDLAPIQLESAPNELRSLVAALNSLLASVQHNLVTQKRFISDAAHQLRTPLSGLKTQTELALQTARDDEQRARLARVHESASRSAHLVNQLLTLARAEPESGHAMGRTRFDLRELAHAITAELVPRAMRAGVDLGFEGRQETATGGGEVVPVAGNALLLREAISNLIDNAIRYAGPGALVTVSLRREGDEVTLDVVDNGPGIAAEDMPRMFERFVRASTLGNGCGLGLSIVKEIVERQQGSVTLSAVQPHGLRASIRLPVID